MTPERSLAPPWHACTRQAWWRRRACASFGPAPATVIVALPPTVIPTGRWPGRSPRPLCQWHTTIPWAKQRSRQKAVRPLSQGSPKGGRFWRRWRKRRDCCKQAGAPTPMPRLLFLDPWQRQIDKPRLRLHKAFDPGTHGPGIEVVHDEHPRGIVDDDLVYLREQAVALPRVEGGLRRLDEAIHLGVQIGHDIDRLGDDGGAMEEAREGTER